MDNYNKVINELLNFRDERDWQQFHDSKNLAIAISIEAAELNELFLWKSAEESNNVKLESIKEELADILSFSFLLADKLKLNPFEIVSEKIRKNGEKYPIEKSKGKSEKYDKL